jgi:beta-glucosidase/6-phospho-beta-glucosidase/beta-galactosidase
MQVEKPTTVARYALNIQTEGLPADFYENYKTDIALIKQMGIPNYRFSFSWSRILPHGIGEINQVGLDFYHKIIDC